MIKRVLRGIPPVVWLKKRLARRAEWVRFKEEFTHFSSLSSEYPTRFALRWADRYPCLTDRTSTTGFDRHYVLHTAWAARLLAGTKPALHVDISSSLYFCSIVSAFMPVRFFDYRPADLKLSRLSTERADLMALPFADRAVESLSCMHVVEHIGLGRYGDPLDPEGDLKAMSELQRALAVGGALLFVVPVGKPKIMYNAHRIYSHRQVVDGFPELSLTGFALVPDDPALGSLIENASPSLADAQNYGCGCFWFKRIK